MTGPASPTRATLRDVAELAGVHPATASRALTGARPVRPEILEAVRAAAESLRYTANPIGRALARGGTATIGVLVPDIGNPFFPGLIRAIEAATAEQDIALLIADADNNPSTEASRVEALLRRHVDGLIISPVDALDSRETMARVASHIPTVQVDRMVDVATDKVVVDQDAVIGLLVDHLRGLGRRRLAYVDAVERISPIEQRRAAYLARLHDDPGARRRVVRAEMSVEAGRVAGARLLARRGAHPDAVICADDLIAVGVLQAVLDHGLRVPEDIAVAGIDDTTLAEVVRPTLTTIAQPTAELSRQALALLLARQAEPERPPQHVALPPGLVVRQSTGPAPR